MSTTAYSMDVVGSENPTHSCSSHAEQGVLLAEVPSEATVLDLVWIGQAALGDQANALDVDRVVRVRNGDTFLGMLGRNGVPKSDALTWYRSSRNVFNLARLKIGRDLRLSFDAQGELSGLEYEIDRLNVFVAERGEDGGIVARKGEVPSTTEVRGVSGTVASNITADCLSAGVPSRVVRQMAGIFSSKVDFKHLRKGDAFRVLYEVKITEDGDQIPSGSQVLAAEVQTRGKSHTALRADDNGEKTYVDLEGVPLQRVRADSDLRYPVEFTRISSRFSTSRLHPKTRRRRPHLGVDFAAPHGTPVRAVADGQIEYAKWHGQMGRTIRIDHGRNVKYDSMYGHLTRYARGIKGGKRVHRGDVIGYVGSTGLATGPHLHFSLVHGKRFVDPLKALKQVQYKKPTRLTGDSFEKAKTRLVSALGTLDDEGPVRLTRFADARDL
ncbi:MAG: peptidoglycan DD-metalloendopeptidase family protein [Candidatus Binatia bacterium]|nr:peptidoglycan DD-metalloendopeptidase family protein [Candidatus Binatia bacterium]